MPDGVEVYDVLFLRTGNSARSTNAECILQRLGWGGSERSAPDAPAGGHGRSERAVTPEDRPPTTRR